MIVQIKDPWHSMDEMPEFFRDVTILAYDDNEGKLVRRCTRVISRGDWNQEKNGLHLNDWFPTDKEEELIKIDVSPKPSMWCYDGELALSEFVRCVKKE